jgi:Leucine-rich repeat (LRR) protein
MSMEKINNFIRSGTFSGQKPGYKFQDGYKGVGYYKDEEPAAQPSPTPTTEAAWSVKCVDGELTLSQDEAAYLQTANLPTGMLPTATVRQVLDAAAAVIAAASANGDYDKQNDENTKPAEPKKKKKKKKKLTAPIVFPHMGERVRDKAGTSTGTVRYIGTVHTSKNEHLNWVGVEWDDVTRGKHDGWLAGPGGGERYFKCAMGAGSFVKAQKLLLSKDFVQVMKDKYEHGGEEESIINSVDTQRGRSKPIILVGMDKVANWHQMNTIKKVSLEGTFAGKVVQEAIAAACPQVKELNLSKTLIGTWKNVAKVGLALPNLRSLRLDFCRLGPRLEYPLASDHVLRHSMLRLQVLILSNTAIPWGQVLALEPALPQLEELHLCGNHLSTFDPPRTTYGSWASTTGDRRGDQRGRVGEPWVGIFKNLKVLNLSGNDIDDWRQIWRFAWLPKLERLMLNENGINNVEHLGNWDTMDESMAQSAITQYNVIYDAEVIEETSTTTTTESDDTVFAKPSSNDSTTDGAQKDYSTVDGASKSKNQDMAKWARQTGVIKSSTGSTLGTANEQHGMMEAPENTIAFFNLRSLSLNKNQINSWKQIDAMNRLPQLENLRVQHTPLNETGGSVSIMRQTFIARIKTLKSLNGGEVRNTERSDAEKLYIQRLLKAKLKELGETKEQPTLGSCVESLVGDHPRVAELLEMHGEPMVRRQTANGKWHGRDVAWKEVYFFFDMLFIFLT